VNCKNQRLTTELIHNANVAKVSHRHVQTGADGDPGSPTTAWLVEAFRRRTLESSGMYIRKRGEDREKGMMVEGKKEGSSYAQVVLLFLKCDPDAEAP